MKDFEPQLPQDDKELAAEQRQVIQQQLVAELTKQPGHTVFEFDLTNGNITPAKIEKTELHLGGERKGHMRTGATVHRKIIQRPQCLYTSALNKENAVKKFAAQYERLVASGHISRQVAPDQSAEIRTAMEQWLVNNYIDQYNIAGALFDMLQSNPARDNQVWKLLEETGDKEYNEQTFMKAAANILKKQGVK